MYVWIALIVGVLLASWWGERATSTGSKRPRIPVTVAASVIAAACVGLTWGLWMLLGRVAISAFGSGPLTAVGGAPLLVVILLPLVAAGLIGFYLVMSPVLGWDAVRTRERVRAMRAAVSTGVAGHPGVRRVWLMDYHGIVRHRPSDALEVETDGPVTTDFESLRAAVGLLRRHRRFPLALDVHAVDPEREFDPELGRLLFDRDVPSNVEENVQDGPSGTRAAAN